MSYVMSPEKDVLKFGDELVVGMVVMPEDLRFRSMASAELQSPRGNQFTKILQLRRSSKSSGGPVSAVLEWPDGFQRTFRDVDDTAWIVRKDSLPGPGK